MTELSWSCWDFGLSWEAVGPRQGERGTGGEQDRPGGGEGERHLLLLVLEADARPDVAIHRPEVARRGRGEELAAGDLGDLLERLHVGRHVDPARGAWPAADLGRRDFDRA